jgi:hypothetical protein
MHRDRAATRQAERTFGFPVLTGAMCEVRALSTADDKQNEVPADVAAAASVWDRARGTIRQFADAIARAKPDNLPSDEIYLEIVHSIWLGEFEITGEGGGCATSLPEVEGFWQGYRKRSGGRTVWENAEGTPQPRPYPAFGRQDLRSALCGDADPPRVKRRKTLPSFEALADMSIEELIDRSSPPDDIFRTAYLDCILIETQAIQRWRKSLAGPEPLYSTGLPGRRTSKHLIMPEAERRLDAIRPDQTFPPKIEVAREVSDWLTVTHPNAAPAKPKTIANQIAAMYRAKKVKWNAKRQAQNQGPK